VVLAVCSCPACLTSRLAPWILITEIRSPLPALAAGGAARNYGRPKLIQYHILLACGPMSLALALHGGPYYIGLAVLLAQGTVPAFLQPVATDDGPLRTYRVIRER